MTASRVTAGRRFLLLLATGFGSGWSPLVPGTVGTLAAMPVAWAATNLLSPLAFAILAVLFVGPAIVAAGAARVHLGRPDPGPVVVDEWAGLFITLIGLGTGPRVLLLAFVAFRLFDILKPFPARRLERLPGGPGIVLDDVVAGIYAHVAVRVALWWWP